MTAVGIASFGLIVGFTLGLIGLPLHGFAIAAVALLILFSISEEREMKKENKPSMSNPVWTYSVRDIRERIEYATEELAMVASLALEFSHGEVYYTEIENDLDGEQGGMVSVVDQGRSAIHYPSGNPVWVASSMTGTALALYDQKTQVA